MLNRLRAFFAEKYISLKSVTISGTKGNVPDVDNRLVLASFLDRTDAEDLIKAPIEELKIDDNTTTVTPTFQKFDAKALKAEKINRTIVITDIPMYAKADPIKAGFLKYGPIVDFHMRTPFKSKFQVAELTFAEERSVKYFENKWSIMIMGEIFRVKPQYYTRDQSDARSNFAAIL
jgi:hypothetical protein